MSNTPEVDYKRHVCEMMRRSHSPSLRYNRIEIVVSLFSYASYCSDEKDLHIRFEGYAEFCVRNSRDSPEFVRDADGTLSRQNGTYFLACSAQHASIESIRTTAEGPGNAQYKVCRRPSEILSTLRGCTTTQRLASVKAVNRV